ncbi:MAG: heparan-alpha-glucosaminide N-acetyltransferase domain-containing protein [Chitinophagaceae bacterium]
MKRNLSIDILRGLIMVIMAIDHVRLYGGIPAGGDSSALFFTRWITHFCAPGFAFLAGVSILFMRQKMNSVNQLSVFLLSRGILLVILEITLIRFLWAFQINYSQFFLAGVIWMLGWCMVLMALLARLKPIVAGITGIVIIVAQQSFAHIPQLLPEAMRNSFSLFWNFIYPTGIDEPENINILYVIVPWIGVMAAGYAFGMVVQLEERKRRKACLLIGGAFILLFIVMGTLSVPANNGENQMPFVLQLLNQRKYPASVLFLLMTLGPLILLIPAFENSKGKVIHVLSVFGKTAMFYYLLHILIIHLSALLVNLIRTGSIHQDWYGAAPYYTTQDEGLRWSLPLLYLVWLVDVVILYFACRWYLRYKTRHPGKRWLRFV